MALGWIIRKEDDARLLSARLGASYEIFLAHMPGMGMYLKFGVLASDFQLKIPYSTHSYVFM